MGEGFVGGDKEVVKEKKLRELKWGRDMESGREWWLWKKENGGDNEKLNF